MNKSNRDLLLSVDFRCWIQTWELINQSFAVFASHVSLCYVNYKVYEVPASPWSEIDNLKIIIPMKFSVKCFSFLFSPCTPPIYPLPPKSTNCFWNNNFKAAMHTTLRLELEWEWLIFGAAFSTALKGGCFSAIFLIEEVGNDCPGPQLLSEYLSGNSLQVATTCSFYSTRRKKQCKRRPQEPHLSSSGEQQADTQENSRHIRGARHRDTPTTLAWCQQKSSQDSASSPLQAAGVI